MSYSALKFEEKEVTDRSFSLKVFPADMDLQRFCLKVGILNDAFPFECNFPTIKEFFFMV